MARKAKKKSKRKARRPRIAVRRKPAAMTAKKKTPRKKVSRKRRTLRRRSTSLQKAQDVSTVAFRPEGLRARSGGQSGDLQGLSSIANADSESVDELLEEGNALEAEIVQGIQDAPDADRSEVTTHEVPE